MKAQHEPLIAAVLLEEAEVMLSRLQEINTERHQINLSIVELRSLLNNWPFQGNEQGQYAARIFVPNEVIHPREYPEWKGFRNALAFDAAAIIEMTAAFDRQFTGVQNDE